MSESTVLGIGIAVAGVLVLLSAAHVYWALGGQVGEGAVLPEHDGQPVFRPSPAAAVVVAIALLGAAVVLALRAGALGYLIGGPWDARLYTPLAFALGLGAVVIAWGVT